MNFVQKYRLYRKFMNPGPGVSRPDPNNTVCDILYSFGFNDGEKRYKVDAIKMEFSQGPAYLARVIYNNKVIATFMNGRMAKKIFKKAESVSSKSIMNTNAKAR